MSSMQNLDQLQSESQVGPSLSSGNMQLLAVPSSTSPGLSPGGSTSRDSKVLRRYSCNPQGKGAHAHQEGSSSPLLRRSSLAAIKWSVLARRISMGLSHEREPPEDPTKMLAKMVSAQWKLMVKRTASLKAIAEVNTQVAHLRDLLIHIGQSRDGPEMREKIRRIRRQTIEACRHAVQIILNQIQNDIADGIPMDFSPQLVLLFFCTQLLLKELRKCKRLVLKLPIDMSSYYAENRPGTSNFAGVLSQIILCRQLNPDFNQEELCSIEKDADEISSLLDEMQEFMPKENQQLTGMSYEEVFGRRSKRRRRNGTWCDFESLCCISKSRRLSGF